MGETQEASPETQAGEGQDRGRLHSPPTRFRNCLAHRVSHRATGASSHTTSFKIAIPQNHTIWTKAQSRFGPHIERTHSGRAFITAR